MVELYTLEEIVGKGIPLVRMEADALRNTRGKYLLGHQEGEYDVLTRIGNAPREGEVVMGTMGEGEYCVLERGFDIYEDLRDLPVRIQEKDEDTGLLMLEDDLALKGPLETLRNAKRIGSLFRLHYSYCGHVSEDNAFSLGLYARSEFSGREVCKERHPFEIVLATGECAGAAPLPKEARGSGYLARMRDYRDSFCHKEFSHAARGCLEDVIDILTGGSRVDGRRIWFWRDRVTRLEEIVTTLEHGSCDDSMAKGLEELRSIIETHRYLRRAHPELWEKVKELLKITTDNDSSQSDAPAQEPAYLGNEVCEKCLKAG